MPTGYPKDRAAAIREKIAEYKERLKDELTFGKKRKSLLEYCKRHGLLRADLKAVADELPLQRITRKHRLAQAKAKAAKKGE